MKYFNVPTIVSVLAALAIFALAKKAYDKRSLTSKETV